MHDSPKLGFIDYNGDVNINNSPQSVVLRD
jgi:hypothetical protein